MSAPRPLPVTAEPGVRRRLRKAVGQAVVGFGMLADGDRVLVALSGGKDSYSLLVLLDELRARAPIRFELVAVHLDQRQPGYDGAPLRAWLEARGGEFHILSEDTYAVVAEKIPAGQTTCGLCSRLRRGILYNAAADLGCTKIALGHHRDDVIETLLLSQLFNGQLKAMPPVLRSDDGRNVVVRPLFLAAEADLAAFAAEQAFPILPCNLCGSQEDLWRQQVKELLADLEARIPDVRASLVKAVQSVRATQLADLELWARLGHSPSEG